MTEPTMRERIARAICRVDALNARQAFPDNVDAFVDAYWESDIPTADAVLAEMETPTEDMECAGVCAVQDADDGASEPWDHVRTTWVAMIAEVRKP